MLGERLGPIRAVVAAARDEGLLTLLLGSFDPSVELALDLRHESWGGIEADLPPHAVRVGWLEGEAPFRYVRLREPPYDDEALAAWAGRLRPLLDDGLRVYCYFMHEDRPTAPDYAARLPAHGVGNPEPPQRGELQLIADARDAGHCLRDLADRARQR